jgi:hypothetical protein
MKTLPVPLLVAGLLLTGLVACESTENVVVVQPQGEFGTIETQSTAEAISRLQRGDSTMLANVQQNPGDYAPPALYELSNQLFKRGRKNEAAYWFYLGQLRARSDANKSLDPSAASGVDVLNETYGYPINQHSLQDLPKLTKTVAQVLADDAKLPRNYDPRWIALHGMDAFLESKVRFQPRSAWAATNAQTRKDYQQGFEEAMAGRE